MPQRTPQEIVNQTNRLAREFYQHMGNVVKEGYRFDHATQPQERLYWTMACAAQEVLTDTDPQKAINELEG